MSYADQGCTKTFGCKLAHELIYFVLKKEFVNLNETAAWFQFCLPFWHIDMPLVTH